MIINTGMRTDIPAFYTPWFLNRLREGFVLVRNPYRPEQVTRYRLSPEVVDLIGFCTKNPAPMLDYMESLEPYGQYWFVTITPYGRDVEPGVPPVDQVLESREKQIIVMRYGLYDTQPLPQREVAQKCGISRSYVSRLEKKALLKLRRALED